MSYVEGLEVGKVTQFDTSGRLDVVYRGDRIEVSVTPSNRQRFLVINQTFNPNWKAYAGAKTIPVLPTNSVMSGVVVPPEEGHIELKFEPFSSSRAASMLMTAAVCGLFGGFFRCVVGSKGHGLNMQILTPCCICSSSRSCVVFPSTLQPDEHWFDGFDPYSGHYQINKCEDCGLLYSSPIFDDGDIQSLYRGYKETNVTSGELPNVSRTMAGYFRLAAADIHNRQRMLDVGCDIGLLLEVARNDGFKELYGLEPVAVAKADAVKRLPDANISELFYEDGLFENDFFDLISLIHVVDHLVRPERTLSVVWKQLKPSGICLAVVHNSESLLAKLLGERFPVFNFFHHYFFTKRLFENYLRPVDLSPSALWQQKTATLYLFSSSACHFFP